MEKEFSKLVGIREKHWEINGKEGKNKTLYFLSMDDSTPNNSLDGLYPRQFTVTPDSPIYNLDLKINEEYLLILGEAKVNANGSVRTPINQILNTKYQKVPSFGFSK